MLSKLQDMSRPTKRSLFWIADTILVALSLYAAFVLRYGTLSPSVALMQSWVLFPVMTVLGAALIYGFGLPRIKLNTMEHRAILQVGVVTAALLATAVMCSYLLRLPAPRSVPFIFAAFFFLGSIALRICGLYLLSGLSNLTGTRTPVAIYGAGSAGIQMAAALRQSREARPVLFIDDNTTLHGLMVAGLPVYAPTKLSKLVLRHKIERVLIAMPSVPKARQNTLVETLAELPVEVQILPSYIDMMTGNAQEDTLRPVSPDDLLGRDKVALDTPEIAKAYAGRNIMVTGAGGSIGSELCRQLVNCQPAKIVLYEHSEFALYGIDRDLRGMRHVIPIVSRLGSVTDRARVRRMITDEGVDIILHAAAYKHVPLVEENELEGARNNVLGTQVVAEEAEAAGIERMILISTDKAVRPTNIMGATKRLAELVIQDIQTRSKTTKFAMVRFGNVLGSSGSVLPLFQAQISAGGPVTVTHPEVTRFFMTIPEAARLVLTAGAYATGGDVFVLDMGKPQKVIDIARRMITLSGRTVKNPKTGEGDIAINVTGLRPGEKLYEELLIDDDSLVGTPHPKILRAEENKLSQMEVAAALRGIQASVEAGDPDKLRKLVAQRVVGYHQQDESELAASDNKFSLSP